MSDQDPLLRSLRAAVEAAPADVPLRVHLARLLLAAGHGDEAVAQAAAALQHDPASAEARELMARALAPTAPPPASAGPAAGSPAVPSPAGPASPVAAGETPSPAVPPSAAAAPGDPPSAPAAPGPDLPAPPEPEPEPGPARPAAGPPGTPGGEPAEESFDWQRAEQQVSDLVPPRFTPAPGTAAGDPGQDRFFDIERSTVRLADVGGMAQVKQRLEAAFLAPLRNPELRRLYGKSLRGGLLLYGPPGCGKTFLARAVAGELGARFVSVTLDDVLDMYIGRSEQNLHEIFRTARRNAPCVVFLDELDALGGKRAQLRHSGLRSVVNQLLGELDGVKADNEGVFVLAATNHPWDVDSALRRPGRLDRTLLVLPPDQEARESILRYHLRDRPVAGVDLPKLARRTDGFSGADLAHLCETAAEAALLDSAATGQARMIGMPDLLGALKEIRPSIDTWLAAARNVALFANEDGTYDELAAYLKGRRKL